MSTKELHLNCPSAKAPDWTPGDTVSFRGAWWFVEEMHHDTQGASGAHFHLIKTIPKSKPILSVHRDEDPGWHTGEVVTVPRGKTKVVTDSSLTTERITYYGCDVAPPDPPAVTDAFA